MLIADVGKNLAGGIRDHVGGGFHRYSTDRYWRVPHFEKMLYDNGQFARVYAQAYELAPRDGLQAGRRRDLRVRAARDDATREADSTRRSMPRPIPRKGSFTSGTREEIEQALTPDEFALWADVYGISGEPNFEGHYIPLLSQLAGREAKKRNSSEAALRPTAAADSQKTAGRAIQTPAAAGPTPRF